MAYKDTLSEIINKSGLSLREIANRCKVLGISISNSYISQLQTGKLPPPSEDVSIAISKVCAENPERLVIEGYLEKAPEIMRYYFYLCAETNKQLLVTLDKVVSLVKSENKEEYEDFCQRYQGNIDSIDRLELLHDSISFLEKVDRSSRKNKINLSSLISEKLFNKKEYQYIDGEHDFMEDDSMEPLIPKSSLLEISSYRTIDKKKHIMTYNDPSNKDVIFFTLNRDGKRYVRRFYNHAGKITLIPENSKYDVIYEDSIDNIFIYGKVIAFKASIT